MRLSFKNETDKKVKFLELKWEVKFWELISVFL
jgi:hypothetical protein